MINLVNVLTGDVVTSVDLDETVEVLLATSGPLLAGVLPPPFSMGFTSAHNMLHDSAVLRGIDPMKGVAGGICPLQQSSRNRDLLKRGQDPNALVLNVDGRFESPLLVDLKTNAAAAVQVLLQEMFLK